MKEWEDNENELIISEIDLIGKVSLSI